MLTKGIISYTGFGGSNLVSEARRKIGFIGCLKRLLKRLIPAWFEHFQLFYTFFFGGALVVFSAFVSTEYQSNAELEQGGLRGTFLPVPGYYDVTDGNRDMQRLVSLIYMGSCTVLYTSSAGFQSP